MKITQNGQYPFYRPWDSGLAKQSLQDSWEGEFSILDLQLGSACNAHCRHCDSSCSSLHESADLDINEVVRLLGEMRQSRNYFSLEHQSEPLWCFICGLGEPTEPTENLPKLLELLDRTAEIGVNFALFNNGLYWDEKLNKHLGGGRLSVQVQVMSNQVEKVAHFMGVSKDEANLQLQHREQIYEVAVQQWDHPQAANGTNVCASIVPMRDNLDELPLLQTYSNLLSAGNLRSGQGNTQKVKPDGLRTLRHCLACTRQCILHRVLAAQVSRHRQHKLA